MADKPKKPHAIFIPYPLQGHLIPSVHLAIKLASQGFTITFINTYSIHHQTSKAALTKTGAGPDMFTTARESGLDIRYTTVSDGLPIGFDRSLNHDQFMAALLHVFSAHVEEAVAEIVSSGEDVHCLIADTFFVWPSKIASKFGLVHVSFWTEPALVFTLYYHMDLLRIHGHFACQDCREDTIDYIPGVEGIEPKDTTSYLQETDTTSVCHQIIFNCFNDTKNADFVICNSVQELESDVLSAIHAKIPFYAIGPILPNDFGKSILSTSLWSESDCIQWLDQKPNGSVLYVAFGSYAHVSKNDLIEIANGLALSKVSFVWVLRPDIVSSDETDLLPDGFKEEVLDRSIIIPWCNQHSVLTHPAIGGFLTHCGWNSILESIWCEVPLLCFPLYTDQFTNRKLAVDDWKVGINMSNMKLISKEDVANNINRLMCGNSKDELRNKIKEVKKTLENAVSPGGSSEQNMAQFMKDLEDRIEKKAQAKEPMCNGT
ncbi:UDP-glycosyltransferase 86A2 [Ricinus communis]|uniref:Glycosyltransferase n=1 Tax=Ricinus communis TaxID=3988 RepID=B9SCH3_RICCO|nr:UDP-glycosyltransferase 86A2 [Ricinus communis]EEF38632.1 UDP-glucosyltransferase, putative [Ricinus communis]|eukprot:XP_002523692.1 UDP-glycosyltransferase 86A2 [Ricinus communis]